MAKENEIKKYTAADIDRYNKGLLSPKERHDLEKAALDDPFLADALEGYATAGVHTAEDLAELQQRLQNRVSNQRSKVVPLPQNKKNTNQWMRVAAMVIILAGAGLLVYVLGFNKKEPDIAMSPSIKQETVPPGTNSNTVQVPPDTSTKSQFPGYNATRDKPANKPKLDVVASEPSTQAIATAPQIPAQEKPVQDQLVERKTENVPAIKERLETKNVQPQVVTVSAAGSARTKSLAREQAGVLQSRTDTTSNNISNADFEAKQRGVVANSKRPDANFDESRANTFRGRVTDNNNNPVPFANVTNVEDNVGTYADARGFFNLTSPDSTLNVQVRSLGFNINNAQLRNNVPNNQVVLQEDKSLNEVVLSNKKPNATTRAKDANMTLEEPEPEDGWDKYDTYLANNIVLSDEYALKKSGSNDVKVSFEVNKYGEPINIKIEKSLCTRCDQEAIRLVKEGPKWKRKARKGRATVTISF